MKKEDNEEQKRGIIIAFIGQDGAGKTTISNIMSEKFKKIIL